MIQPAGQPSVVTEHAREPGPAARGLGCVLLAVMVGLLVAAVAYVTVFQKPQEKAGSGRKGGSEAGRPIPVKVARAVRRTIPVEIRAVGNVMPYSTVAITSQVTGQLQRIHFKQGDFVRRCSTSIRAPCRPASIR